jgi:Flp pilus assembly CpaE family ATPase
VAFNLCVTLHRITNEKVIAADFRPGQGAFRVLAGERDAGGLSRLMQQDSADLSASQVERELIQHRSGFRLLLASDDPSDAGQIASVGHFETITRRLAGLANYVVLDLGPALPPTTTQILEQMDQIILVLEPVPQTVAQSKLMLEGLRRYGVGHSRVSVVAVNRGGTSLQLTLSQMEDQLGCPVLVVFPPAAELAYRAAKDGQPMVSLQPDSLIAEHFAKLAESISR